MKYLSLLLAGLPLLGAVAAAPSVDVGISKRGTPGNVMVCTGLKYTNDCKLITPGTSGACTKLPFNSIGSAGPDKGAICRIYENAGCTGSYLTTVSYPGIANLYNSPLEGADLGNKAHYIACTACKGYGNCQG